MWSFVLLCACVSPLIRVTQVSHTLPSTRNMDSRFCALLSSSVLVLNAHLENRNEDGQISVLTPHSEVVFSDGFICGDITTQGSLLLALLSVLISFSSFYSLSPLYHTHSHPLSPTRSLAHWLTHALTTLHASPHHTCIESEHSHWSSLSHPSHLGTYFASAVISDYKVHENYDATSRAFAYASAALYFVILIFSIIQVTAQPRLLLLMLNFNQTSLTLQQLIRMVLQVKFTGWKPAYVVKIVSLLSLIVFSLCRGVYFSLPPSSLTSIGSLFLFEVPGIPSSLILILILTLPLTPELNTNLTLNLDSALIRKTIILHGSSFPTS